MIDILTINFACLCFNQKHFFSAEQVVGSEP